MEIHEGYLLGSLLPTLQAMYLFKRATPSKLFLKKLKHFNEHLLLRITRSSQFWRLRFLKIKEQFLNFFVLTLFFLSFESIISLR